MERVTPVNLSRTPKHDKGYLGIDPDTAVYRIFPLWFFEEVLRLRQIVMVRPITWDDPFELLLPRVFVEVTDQVPYAQKPLESHLSPVYAQCWSATHDSDTLQRAYSRVVKDRLCRRNTCPADEGVRVRSTPRKLLESLRSWATGSEQHNAYIGTVHYHTAQEIQQSVANEIAQFGLEAYAEPHALACASLRKRQAFRHEAEVRLLYIEKRAIQPEPFIRVPVDPNLLFDEITFDPRLEAFERIERENNARSLGYTGAINASDLYQGALTLVSVKSLGRKP